uniref:Nicastrin n=1 Tax=Dendroctonus ponderosae TaxID=77166 RepID=A0AAR5Q431_DENPD
MSKSHFAIYLVQLLLVVGPSDADRIKDTMYMKISGSVACYRRMNATHQIGCSSARGGSVGVVHYCDSATDLDFILKNGSAGPYIPVLPISLLSAETVSKLSSSKVKISGLLLHANSENLLQMSHENQCPNDIFNVQQAPKTCPDSGGWNPWGTGLLYADVPFPMFYMHNDSEVSAIRHCFQAFNNHSFATQAARSLCSLELNAFMYGTTNTQTCIRRSNVVTNLNPVKFCDPLGDSNVWGALFPLVTGEENDSQPIRDAKYIVVAARLDTTSLFEETAGAESPITGAVALLTVAKLLKEMLPAAAASVQTNVLFILFNGETYDYIGSQRLLYDMERGHFPTDLPPNNPILPTIYPENVTLFIELSQLGVGEATYAHYLSADAWLGKFAANLTRNNPSTVVPLKPTPDSLPPSSLHTFIRGNTSIRGLVLANHQTAYQNRFYNSLFDNSSNIGYRYYNGSEIGAGTLQRHIADVATMVAKSVFEEVTGQAYQGGASPSLLLVSDRDWLE